MIYGEKVYLRPFTRADLPIFKRWANNISHNSEFNTFGLVRSDALEAGFDQGGLLDSRQGDACRRRETR